MSAASFGNTAISPSRAFSKLATPVRLDYPSSNLSNVLGIDTTKQLPITSPRLRIRSSIGSCLTRMLRRVKPLRQASLPRDLRAPSRKARYPLRQDHRHAICGTYWRRVPTHKSRYSKMALPLLKISSWSDTSKRTARKSSSMVLMLEAVEMGHPLRAQAIRHPVLRIALRPGPLRY
jgi:hypothetical protein